MIKVFPFLPADLVNFAPKYGVSSEYLNTISTDPAHKAFVLKAEGLTIALCSFVEVKEGVGLASFVPSIYLRKYQIRAIRTLKKLLDYGRDEYNLFRMQMTVKKGFHEGRRFAEILGFDCEGCLKHYNRKGENFWLYARVL